MKKCDALKLQEGDLVNVKASLYGGDLVSSAKVLIVTARGGVYLSRCSKWECSFWTQYNFVKPLGKREELTETERKTQLYEVERFKEYHQMIGQKNHDRWIRRLNKLKPKELYIFVWDKLYDGKSHSFEELKAQAKDHGLEAEDIVWERIGRALVERDADPNVWKLRKPMMRVREPAAAGKLDNAIVMPTQ